MQIIASVMTRTLVTLQETDSLEMADNYLELGHIRHLPVVRGRKLVGLITHRDLLRNCDRKDTRTGAPLIARDVMTTRVMVVHPETSTREAIRMMLTNKFGCLPVTTEAGTLVGIVTESDLLRVADEHLAALDSHEAAADWD
jgi:CBS domain-containing protein